MKKIVYILTVMTMCFLTIILFIMSKKEGSDAFSQGKENITQYKYEVIDKLKKTAAIIHVENPEKCLVIPDEIDGYKITKVGIFDKIRTDKRAGGYDDYLVYGSDERKTILSEGKDMVEEVRFPETVEIIGAGAFDQCKKLKKVVFPKGLKIIADYAFRECVLIENISLGKNLEGIGCHAFWGCDNLKKLVIKSNKVKIGVVAFACGWDGSLKTIELPFNFYGELMEGSFSGYRGETFKWLNFKGETESMGFLYDLENLKKIIFPRRLKKIVIGRDAISPMYLNNRLVIPSHVKEFTLNQMPQLFNQLVIKGKNTRLEGDLTMGKTLSHYICAKTIIAPKGSKAEKFTKNCKYPLIGKAYDEIESDAYYDESNIPMKKVKFIGVSLPKKPSISVKGKKVKWKKVRSADRYEVYYSSKKKGTYKKLTTTGKNSSTLKRKGYLKVRSVKRRYGVDWKSGWSSVVKIRK